VCGDAEPVLAAASAGNTGIALICGTGSLAWGRNAAGVIARCGGWGYLMSDEGSGYAIAMAGLRAAVRHADGRGPPTELLGSMMVALNAKSPQAIVEGVYGRTREQLADLCKVVFELAVEDVMALSIVEAAAEDLAELVVVLRQKLTLSDDDFHLALTGSVILKQESLQAALELQLAANHCRPRSITRVSEPVRGAVALARALSL
jgi:N-acetylglucosamine kinase-like BadF-type ATPase